MAFGIYHSLVMTAPDDPAFENNPSDWNAALVVAGADVGGIPHCPTATTIATSANLTYTETSQPTLTIGGNALLKVGTNATGGQITVKDFAYMTYDGTAKFGSNAAASAAIVCNTLTKGLFSVTAGAGLAITAGTATTDVNALSATQTWNAAGVAFTGLELNITVTAAAAASKIFDFQKDGSSALMLRNAGGAAHILSLRSGATTSAPDFEIESSDGSRRYVTMGPSIGGGLGVVSGYFVGFSSSATNAYAGIDSAVSRISAGLIGVGTGAAASFAGRIKFTSGIAAAVAVGALNAAPTVGEVQSVNDSLAPAVGAAVAAGGAANALVWWNGAQWTVIGV